MTLPVNSLNGLWERGRRLFRLNAGADRPEGITPVWIAGDSREPFGQTNSYRRFSVSFIQLIAIGNGYKLRADADLVIERIWWSQTGGTNPPLYLASAAATAAFGAFAAVTTVNSAWRDTPDGSSPPLSISNTAGTAGNVLSYPTPNAQGPIESIYLPMGSALIWYAPGSASTATVYLEGLLRGGG